jgi:hypothetical protein
MPPAIGRRRLSGVSSRSLLATLPGEEVRSIRAIPFDPRLSYFEFFITVAPGNYKILSSIPMEIIFLVRRSYTHYFVCESLEQTAALGDEARHLLLVDVRGVQRDLAEQMLIWRGSKDVQEKLVAIIHRGKTAATRQFTLPIPLSVRSSVPRRARRRDRCGGDICGGPSGMGRFLSAIMAILRGLAIAK